MVQVRNKMVKVTVANCKTLVMQHLTQTKTVYRDIDGKTTAITVPIDQSFGPGSVVEVPESDVAWLRSIGTVLEEGEVFRPGETNAGWLAPGQPGYVNGRNMMGPPVG